MLCCVVLCCVARQLPKAAFSSLLAYIEPLQGAARQRLLSDAQRALSQAATEQRSTEVSSGNAGSGSGSGSVDTPAEDKQAKRAVQRAKKIVRVLS